MDRSGMPRPVEDVDDAINVVSDIMVKFDNSNPKLLLVCPTILDVLKSYRRAIVEALRREGK